MERNCDAHHARLRGLNGSLRVVGAHNSSPPATLGLLVSAKGACPNSEMAWIPINWAPGHFGASPDNAKEDPG